jgi:hypothetical protein
MEPFESIYLGSFIFTLGYLARAAGFELRQQTAGVLCRGSGDQLIGDTIHRWGGRNFIIEFRRCEERVRDEFRQPHRRKLLEFLSSPEGAALRRSSRRGHFIAYGMTDRKIGGLVFMRYFEATDHPSQMGSHLGLAPFFEGVVTNHNAGLAPDEFKEYLGGLSRICASILPGDADASERSLLSSTILNYDPASKSMKFAVVDLMRLFELPLERPASRPPAEVPR